MTAWSGLAMAVATVVLAMVAVVAWKTAKATLDASRRASAAAEAANEQARLDSIARTRPYVYVEVIPGLAGVDTYDVRVFNSGRSAAQRLTLDYDSWPDELDDIAQALKTMFTTPRTLPPGCSLRAMWRLGSGQGTFTDGTTEAGLGTTGKITVHYSGDDPSEPYSDQYDVQIEGSGIWPVPEQGPEPGSAGDRLDFYKLGQALVRRVGELQR